MTTPAVGSTSLFSDVTPTRPLTAKEQAAVQLTRRIRISLESAYTLIVEAFESRAWEALGYQSWDMYCKGEFSGMNLQPPLEQREQVILSMREAGMSSRAIGSATDIHYSTVARTLRKAELPGVASATPGRENAGRASTSPIAPGVANPIKGLDGRNYPAKQRPHMEVPADSDSLWDQSADDIGIGQIAVPTSKARKLPPQHQDIDGALSAAITSIGLLTSNASLFDAQSREITRELGETAGRAVLSTSHLVAKLDYQTLALDDRGLAVFRQNVQDSLDLLARCLDELPLMSVATQ
ncbi:hypothetical protein SAMN04489740_3991 [Arthrobacter alpinus]|uniref:Uncharacterized protein n=2 Tax=Arthrobacter alpinus TaxID=656366 RepID=A0A1H5PBF6_9MICC|nr:helix-turn-helix domain-containing protein [Arthrobacter alpinus]SEF10418.1 hypothetical protein SAMN04489740_3991 [Arthrobacter alpinus]